MIDRSDFNYLVECGARSGMPSDIVRALCFTWDEAECVARVLLGKYSEVVEVWKCDKDGRKYGGFEIDGALVNQYWPEVAE